MEAFNLQDALLGRPIYNETTQYDNGSYERVTSVVKTAHGYECEIQYVLGTGEVVRVYGKSLTDVITEYKMGDCIPTVRVLLDMPAPVLNLTHYTSYYVVLLNERKVVPVLYLQGENAVVKNRELKNGYYETYLFLQAVEDGLVFTTEQEALEFMRVIREARR